MSYISLHSLLAGISKISEEYHRAVGNADVGKVVRVIVYRDGKTQTIKVTLGQREVAEKVAVIPEAKVPESIKEAEDTRSTVPKKSGILRKGMG